MGAQFKSVVLAAKTRHNMVVLSSIDGIIYLLIKKGWMTREEADIEDAAD